MQPKILYEKPFSFEDIQIEHCAESLRHLDETTEQEIMRLRNYTLQNQPHGSLWNGTRYRVNECSKIFLESENNLSLSLGTIPYKDIFVVNSFKEKFLSVPPRYHLFTGVLLRTSDNFFIF